MTDRDRIIDYMKTWVGYTEKDTCDKVGVSMDSPEVFSSRGKNNYTIFAKEYFKQTGIQVQGEPWCDTFIDSCFIKVFGKEKARQYLGGFSAYTPDSANFFKTMHQWSNTAKVGSLVFFKNNVRICHTGMVYGEDDKYIYSVEGNTSNDDKFNANGGCVALKKHLKNSDYIAGYGEVKYMNGTGWQAEESNWKYYQNSNIVTDKFIESNGLRYYVGSDGNMAVGQVFINGDRHVFNSCEGIYKGAELVINDTKGVKIL